MNRITFLLTNPPNPRMQKRVRALRGSFDCSLVCIRRTSADVYSYDPSLFSGITEKEFDLPNSDDFFKRILSAPGVIAIQEAALREYDPDYIYVQGVDCLLTATRYFKEKRLTGRIIYEIADMRSALFESKGLKAVRNRAIQAAEKKALACVGLVVVTSEKFIDFRYGELVGSDRILFIPNVPDLNAFKSYEKKKGGEFTVGYVGVLRYIDQMKLLVDAVTELGDIDVVFSGEAATKEEGDDIKRYCAGNERVSFTGQYNYDADIAGIYSRFDCVYAVYDASNPNVRIALPNKLYESVVCGLPLIVSAGTYLSEIVERYGIGVAVDPNDVESLREALSVMMKRGPEYEEMVRNCAVARERLIANTALAKLPGLIAEMGRD